MQVAVQAGRDGRRGVEHGTGRAFRVVMQASSSDGGASFSMPTPIARHDRSVSGIGMVLSLAVSPSGRLGLCWPRVARSTPSRRSSAR